MSEERKSHKKKRESNGGDDDKKKRKRSSSTTDTSAMEVSNAATPNVEEKEIDLVALCESQRAFAAPIATPLANPKDVKKVLRLVRKGCYCIPNSILQIFI
jgi:hypothetical protein